MPRWRSESASVRSINGVARANNGGSALAASICPAPALSLRSNSTALARDAILASGQTLRCPNEGWQSLSNHDEHATTAAYRVVVLSLNQRGCPPRFNERTTDWHRPQPIDLPCPAAPLLARRLQSGSNQAARRLFGATAVLDLRTGFFSATSAAVTRAKPDRDAAKTSR
jgi:hypothetical protein